MRAAIKWGALVGLASYLLVGLGLTVLGVLLFGNGPATVDANPGKLSLACGSLFLLLFAASAAGYFAGRETRNAGMGALAGMLAFAVYGTLITLYAPGSSANVFSQDVATQGGFILAAMAIFVTISIPLGIAALMGWLGGRPGAARARRAAKHAGETPAPVIEPSSDVSPSEG